MLGKLLGNLSGYGPGSIPSINVVIILFFIGFFQWGILSPKNVIRRIRGKMLSFQDYIQVFFAA